MSTTPVTRRMISFGVAVGVACLGTVALSAPAHAMDGNTKVFVCKYVGKPGVDERLKAGKNPIEVSANSLVDVKNGATVAVGEEFADAQGRSIVVQIGGNDPGVGACNPSPPPPVTPPQPPVVPIPDEPATPGTTPGTGAPVTGGDGSDLPLGLMGGGVLLAGAGLLAAEARRRRRGLAGS